MAGFHPGAGYGLMFDTLTNKLQKVFKDLRGLGNISESNRRFAARDPEKVKKQTE